MHEMMSTPPRPTAHPAPSLCIALRASRFALALFYYSCFPPLLGSVWCLSWGMQVYKRVNFLLDHGFRVSRDDLQLFHTTYNWPHNIKTYLARSAELQRSRKQDLEMVVEGQQEQLLREVE